MSTLPFPNLPDYMSEETVEVIHTRMLENAPQDIDRAEGSFIFDATGPVAMEVSEVAKWHSETLRRAFIKFMYGDYLINAASAHGIERRAAAKATGTVTVTGSPNTTYQTAGKRVAVPEDDDSPAVEFVMDTNVTTNETGSGVVGITAVNSGESGNVPVGAISLLVDYISGITSVNNIEATSGGLDIESEDSIRERLIQKLQNPASSGTNGDYIRWALEVPGVERVKVIPSDLQTRGIVNVYVVDETMFSASDQIIANVQNHIYPRYEIVDQAEVYIIGSGWGLYGNYPALDSLISYVELPDASDGMAVELFAQGNPGPIGVTRTIYKTGEQDILPKPGMWEVSVRIRSNESFTGTAGAFGELFVIGVRDSDTGSWLKTTSIGNEDAVLEVKPDDIGTTFSDHKVRFWWTGTQNIQLLAYISDGATPQNTYKLYIDKADYNSYFSNGLGQGVAPETAYVIVNKPEQVLVIVNVKPIIEEGYNEITIRQKIITSITDYFRSIVFQTDNDVKYSRVSQAILDVEGVADHQDLSFRYRNNSGQWVNATTNIVIPDTEVAVLQAVNWV